MKVLTIRQPWATLTALGIRTIEMRSWSTKYRGPLAIHAGVKKPRRIWSQFEAPAVYNPYAMDRYLDIWEDVDNPGQFAYDWRGPLGAIVATCTITECVPIGHLPASFVFGTERYPTLTDPSYEVDFSGDIWSGTHRMTPQPGNRGYLRVQIGGRGATPVAVHRLVAEAWLGPKPPGKEIRHVDGDHLNNAPWNLRYGTSSENKGDSAAQGRTTGANNHNTRFTAEEIEQIRGMLLSGIRVTAVARHWGVTHSAIQKIRDGRSHRGEYSPPDDSVALSRYAYLLADVVPVDPPVPFKGGQGLSRTWEPSTVPA